MTGVSPVEAGGVHCRLTAPAVARAFRLVGAAASLPAPGPGVTGADGSDGALAPAGPRAVTVTVTGVPSVSPPMATYPVRWKSAPPMVALWPSEVVAVYEVGAAPSEAGFHAT